MQDSYSVSEICEQLNVSKSSIYRFIRNNDLQEVIEGNMKKYLSADVEKMKEYFLEREQDIRTENEMFSLEKAVSLALEKQKETFEKFRIKELERLLSEALEREKKLEHLLNQQQQLHYTYQTEDKKEKDEAQKESRKKILPPLTLEDSLFETSEKDTKKLWWSFFGKK